MKNTAIIHTGSFYHLALLADPAIVALDLTPIHAADLAAAATSGQLDEFDSVFLACRQHPTLMERNAPAIREFIDRPNTKLIVGGENQVEQWLPNLEFRELPTNFWAWRTGEDVGRRERNLDHFLWKYLDQVAVHWHFHGAVTAPAGATSLVEISQQGQDVGSILYYDDVSFRGEMVVTTMDPSYHHGAGFMPGATQLLYRTLRWATS